MRLELKDWPEFNQLNKRVFGERAPSPDEATVVVQRCEGEIVGCLAVTWVPVVTNVWVKEERRKGMEVLRAMIDEAFELFPEIKVALTYTKDKRLARFHRLMGLRAEGYVSSWRRE